MVYYAYKAYQGEYFVIPVVTDFMKAEVARKTAP